MTQKDVVRVIGAMTRYTEALGEPPEVLEQARADIAAVLAAAVEAMAFEGISVDDICKRIKGE